MTNYQEKLMTLKTIRHVVFAAVICALAVTMAQAGQAKTDVTGAWAFEVTTDAGVGTPNVTLKQDGEKLTGHYSSQTLGEADLTGTVKGNDITFNFQADLGGQSVPVSYKGTIEGGTSMKGTLDIAGGMATGTFTAKKK